MSILRRKPKPLTTADVLDAHLEVATLRAAWLREKFLVVRENGEWIAYDRPTKGRAWPFWRYTKADPERVQYRELVSPFRDIGEPRLPVGP